MLNQAHAVTSYTGFTPSFRGGMQSGFRVPVEKASNVVPLFGCHKEDKADIAQKTKADPPETIDIDAERPGDEKLGLLQRLCLKAIAWYQRSTRYIDPEDGRMKNKLGCVCPFTPSCSTYTAEAIRKNGAILGVLMGAYRVLFKCNGIVSKIKTGTDSPGPRAIEDPVPDLFGGEFFKNLRIWFGFGTAVKQAGPEDKKTQTQPAPATAK